MAESAPPSEHTCIGLPGRPVAVVVAVARAQVRTARSGLILSSSSSSSCWRSRSDLGVRHSSCGVTPMAQPATNPAGVRRDFCPMGAPSRPVRRAVPRPSPRSGERLNRRGGARMGQMFCMPLPVMALV
jgi:hypothetical protein